VKQNKGGSSAYTANIPLGVQDMFSPTGGLFSATNCTVLQYMIFAYKLTLEQIASAQSELPKWATSDRYDIQARAPGNPTKDQFRLAMQALVLDKPGKMGPHLQQHAANQACSTAVLAQGDTAAMMATVAGGFPAECGSTTGYPSPTVPGQVYVGARDVPLAMMATAFTMYGNPAGLVGRPFIDRTGLTGKFDFFMVFTPELNGPTPPGATFQPDPTGPTFNEALKEQLGLKLESTTGPVDVLVLDHIEEPSPN
jgi:uncharacterized protein (TIGR03435 family)